MNAFLCQKDSQKVFLIFFSLSLSLSRNALEKVATEGFDWLFLRCFQVDRCFSRWFSDYSSAAWLWGPGHLGLQHSRSICNYWHESLCKAASVRNFRFIRFCFFPFLNQIGFRSKETLITCIEKTHWFSVELNLLAEDIWDVLSWFWKQVYMTSFSVSYYRKIYLGNTLRESL